jgi:ubiquinone/menaquinone biosynthesis C-methylase UbiE
MRPPFLFITSFISVSKNTCCSRSQTSSTLLQAKDESNNNFEYEPRTRYNSNRRNFLSSTLLSLFFVNPQESNALKSSDAEASYDRYAKSYDDLDGGAVADSLGIAEARTKLIGSAKGHVLEVAVGTGLNLGQYKFASSPSAMDGVTSLTLLDISDGMLSKAKTKIEELSIPSYVKVKFIKADATSLEVTSMFGQDSFDTVVDTFSLCVMGYDGAKNCLKQMYNVVKSNNEGGRIILLENSRSSNAMLGWYQDLTAETAAKVGGKGCVSNQNVRSIIEAVDGLQIKAEDEFASGLFRSFICTKT